MNSQKNIFELLLFLFFLIISKIIDKYKINEIVSCDSGISIILILLLRISVSS